MAYDIKIYEGTTERETIRDLNYAQMNSLMRAFEREGVTASAIENEKRELHESVNSTVHW